jgi:hypothetical protein
MLCRGSAGLPSSGPLAIKSNADTIKKHVKNRGKPQRKRILRYACGTTNNTTTQSKNMKGIARIDNIDNIRNVPINLNLDTKTFPKYSTQLERSCKNKRECFTLWDRRQKQHQVVILRNTTPSISLSIPKLKLFRAKSAPVANRRSMTQARSLECRAVYSCRRQAV